MYKCTFDNGVKPVNLVKINDLMYKQNLVTKLYVMWLIMKWFYTDNILWNKNALGSHKKM